MNSENAQVYEIVVNCVLKLIVVSVVCAGWLMMVWALIKDPNYPLGVATAGTPFAVMGTICNYLFPTPKKSKKGKGAGR